MILRIIATVLIILAFLVAIGLIVLYFYMKSKESLESMEYAKVVNFLPQFTDGSVFGVEKECKVVDREKMLVTYIPNDLTKNQLENNELREHSLILPRVKRLILNKGDSSGRPLFIYVPDTKKEIPVQLQKTIFGDFIENKINSDHEIEMVNKYQRGIRKTSLRVMEEYPVDVVDKFAKRTKELFAALRDIAKGGEVKKGGGASSAVMEALNR